MLAAQYVPTNVFGPLAGPISTLLLDGNYNQIAALLNNPLTYENYLQDTGTVNAVIVAFPTGAAPSAYVFGLRIVVKVAATNTGSTAINVNGLGGQIIRNVDQSVLAPGQLAGGALALLVYDGANFILLGGLLPALSGPGSSALGARRRNVNGCGMIDQINNGGNVTPAASAYFLDNWYVFMTQASKVKVGRNLNGATPPKGSSYYVGAQVAVAVATPGATDAFFLAMPIEGMNIEDLEWGTANAKAIGLSFWFNSSLVGAFSGAVRNGATNRSYPFQWNYFNPGNWQKVFIPITGDTGGTWAIDTALGMVVDFSLGAGSNFQGTGNTWAATNAVMTASGLNVISTLNATYYVTQVQVEDIGTNASPSTPYEKWTADRELAACQRYLPAFNGGNSADDVGWGGFTTTSGAIVGYNYPVEPRIAPTGITVPNVASFNLQSMTAGQACNAISFSQGGKRMCRLNPGGAGAIYTVGQAAFLYGNVAGAQILFTGAQFSPV